MLDNRIIKGNKTPLSHYAPLFAVLVMLWRATWWVVGILIAGVAAVVALIVAAVMLPFKGI